MGGSLGEEIRRRNIAKIELEKETQKMREDNAILEKKKLRKKQGIIAVVLFFWAVGLAIFFLIKYNI